MNARWLAPFVLTLSLFCVCAAPVFAQGGESVLLLGVQRGGKVDPKLTKSLRDSMTKGGELLLKDNVLAPPERLCSNETCLGQLASREGARAVLGAQLQEAAPGSSSQYIIMMMYDADRRVSAEERTICDKCTPPQTVSALHDLANRLLKDARDKRSNGAAPSPTSGSTGQPSTGTPPEAPAAAPETPPPSPAPGTAPATTLPTENPNPQASGDFFSRWPTKRKVAAGVLAGLLVATLIPTIALFATDGQDTNLLGCANTSGFCKLQNKPLWAAGFGLSGALAIGIGITFAWPQPKPATPAATVEIPTLPAESK